jgi:hypothetical protein
VSETGSRSDRDDAPLSAECKRLLAQVRKRCPGLLPSAPLDPGTTSDPVEVTAEEAGRLLPLAALAASGLDHAQQERGADIIWREGDRELLIHAAKVSAAFAPGVVAVSIPVRCDQSDEALVHVSFAVGHPRRPAGLIAATESRPRGPAVVVDAWGDNLVAFAWHALLELVGGVAGEAGRDLDGAPLVPVSLAAGGETIAVRPMARHAFDRVRG